MLRISAPADLGGTGTECRGEAVGYGWLLVMVLTVLGLRSPGEWVSGPCSTSSSCTASAPGLTQTLVTWDFSATLAAYSQRCFHRLMEYPSWKEHTRIIESNSFRAEHVNFRRIEL